MSIRKSIILLLTCLALPMVGQAQSAHWAITPSYQSITHFAPNLFKVKTYASTGICDGEEKWVVSLAMDSITNITNGYALAMTKNKDKYRIVYIIRENGTREAVTEEVYAGDYPFFIEDRCAVTNKKGKYGFLTPSGKLAVPCNYTAVRPFRNGRALVSKEKGGFDKLSKGKAKISEIDPDGKVLGSSEAVVAPFDAESLGKVNMPYEPTPDPSYQLFTENKRHGYKKDGATLLPTQFEEAEKVADDCAIVMVDHLYGVVKFNTATVECSVKEAGGKLTAEAEIPSVWENKVSKLTRIVNDASRKEFEMEGVGTARTLKADVPGENGKRIYELACEKLVLWRSLNRVDDHKSSVNKGSSDGITVSAPASVKANKKGICAVAIKVTNRGSSARTVNISLSTGQKSSLQVPAKKSGSVTVNVPVTKKTSCTITARGGGASSSCTVTLNPAIVL